MCSTVYSSVLQPVLPTRSSCHVTSACSRLTWPVPRSGARRRATRKRRCSVSEPSAGAMQASWSCLASAAKSSYFQLFSIRTGNVMYPTSSSCINDKCVNKILCNGHSLFALPCISMGYFFPPNSSSLFFLISVKHKIVFARQCISMTNFHRRGHS